MSSRAFSKPGHSIEAGEEVHTLDTFHELVVTIRDENSVLMCYVEG